jgi:hypothetical protein
MAPKIEPKKVIIVEPEPEFNPPTETPAEIEARKRAEREAEQEELDNAWKKIPYVDKKHLQAGYYAGLEMERLWKPWQMAIPSIPLASLLDVSCSYHQTKLSSHCTRAYFPFHQHHQFVYIKDYSLNTIQKWTNVPFKSSSFSSRFPPENEYQILGLPNS